MNKTVLGFLFLLFYTFAVSYNGKQHQELPASLQTTLSRHQQQDDIVSWVYDLLDWFAADPATRINSISEKTALWRQPNTPEEIQAWLDLIVNQGYGYLLAGDIIASTDAYQKAYQFASAHPEVAEEQLVLEHILKPLGNNYTRLGDYEQAMFIHKKAQVLAMGKLEPTTMAGILSNMANTAIGLGDFKQAQLYCKEALQLKGIDVAIQGLVLAELAEAEQGLGFVEAARTAIKKSLQLLQTTTNKASNNWLFMAYQKAGDLYGTDPVIANNYLDKARQLQLLSTKGSIRARETAKLFYRKAVLEFQQQNLAGASQWADSCLHVLLPAYTFSNFSLDAVYGENTLVDLFFTKALITQNPSEKMKYFQACFATEKKLRNSFITGAAREKAVADTRFRYESAIAAALEAYEQTKLPKFQELVVLFMEGSKSQLLLYEMNQTAAASYYNNENDSLYTRIKLLEQAVVFFEKELQQPDITTSDSAMFNNKKKQTIWDLSLLKKQRYPNNTTQDLTNNFSIKSVQSLLLPDQRMRLYFAGTHKLYCAELDATGIQFTTQLQLPVNWGDTVQAFMQTYFETGPNAMLEAPAQYYQSAYSIYQTLSQQHAFEAGLHYILLPDGFLNKLPFEALVTHANYTTAIQHWPYLLHRSLFTYAWSLETFYQQLKHPSKGSGVAGFFLSHTNTNHTELAAVKNEYETIHNILPQATLLLDEQSTVNAFKAAFVQSTLLHISTHAFVGQEQQLVPKIQLYDAAFYQFETSLLQSHPALVLLNACKTGAGKQLSGEGLQSLARSFIATGTNAVVAGWWNVHDAAAAQLMQTFYRAIDQQTAPAVALQQAKLQWLKNEEVHYAQKLPYYWAALNYHGNPNPDLSAIHQTLQLELNENVTAKAAVTSNYSVPFNKKFIVFGVVVLATAIGLIFLYKRNRRSI